MLGARSQGSLLVSPISCETVRDPIGRGRRNRRDHVRSSFVTLGAAFYRRVEVEGPTPLELVLRQRDETMLINLINRGTGETLSPRRVIVEELTTYYRYCSACAARHCSYGRASGAIRYATCLGLQQWHVGAARTPSGYPYRDRRPVGGILYVLGS